MRTYLFDFDGTLVDSMPTYASVMTGILDKYAIPYGSDIMKIITPLGVPGAAEYYIQLGLDRPKDALIEEMQEQLRRQYRDHIPAKCNVVPVLQALKARGDSLNVLTAAPHENMDPCLKRLGLYDLFENIWACEDFGTTKSDPEIYRMAARRLGRQVEEVLFLDDNLNADRTAKAAGMQVCGVYDASSHAFTEEIKAVSDFYIYDFSELPDL